MTDRDELDPAIEQLHVTSLFGEDGAPVARGRLGGFDGPLPESGEDHELNLDA